MENDIECRSEEPWDIAEVISKELNLRRDVVINLINMVEKEECTVPFIARYRKERTDGMDPDGLRNFTSLLNELRLVQKKASKMIKNIAKQGNLDKKTECALMHAQTVEELEHIHAPFKAEKKGTLANRARALGLDEAAHMVLNQPGKVNLRRWVTKGIEGRATLSQTETGVKHIIADIISKEKETTNKIREIFKPCGIRLESKISSSKKKILLEKTSESKSTGPSEKRGISSCKNNRDDEKFAIYYDFSCKVQSLESYQILAINRGEAKKILSVKIIVDSEMENRFLEWCSEHWIPTCGTEDIKKLVSVGVTDSFTRLIKPFVIRKARCDLTKKAQIASVDVFRRNLKKLLLTPPVRGKVILGVDPGFKNGCKCAVISDTKNEILATNVIHLNSPNIATDVIKRMHKMHNFDVIAIGNGTACRQAEKFFSEFIFNQNCSNLAYCIVNENGASIYSITKEAESEMPNLDPNLRSAVSIARRLQDPLVELVKIDPKHLGVGMYQHDIPDALIKTALNDVIEDCVTYVGVDLNIASISLLRHVAGLSFTQAANIIERREKLGAFVNRQQLLDVKGIGEKTYQQCVGFIRINQTELASKDFEMNKKEEEIEKSVSMIKGLKRKRKAEIGMENKKAKFMKEYMPNPLDKTWIHPESYDTAYKFINQLNLSIESLGNAEFIQCVRKAVQVKGHKKLAQDLSVGAPTIELIITGLMQPTGYRDIRSEMAKPLFRQGATSIQDLKRGSTIFGRVSNVTDFGIFVDVGVGQDGLVHCSDVRGRWDRVKEYVGPNDTVKVTIKFVDCNRRRIGLELCHVDLAATKFA